MLNKTILIGRIGQKTASATAEGKTMMQFSIATTKSYKDKDSGDWKENTQWHRLAAFNQCAEHIERKLDAGDLVYVEGELRTRKWQDKLSGENRYTTEIVVTDFPKKLPRYFSKNDPALPTETGPVKPLVKGAIDSYALADTDVPF